MPSRAEVPAPTRDGPHERVVPRCAGDAAARSPWPSPSPGADRRGERFIAVQLAGSVSILVMAAMTFVFDQASSIDLAVTFGVLSLPAALLYAVFLERWL